MASSIAVMPKLQMSALKSYPVTCQLKLKGHYIIHVNTYPWFTLLELLLSILIEKRSANDTLNAQLSAHG